MPTRRKFSSYAGKNSLLYGYNYGIYPLHKFRHLMMPEGIYPVFSRHSGYDEWHCQCLRKRKNSSACAIEYVTDGIFIFTHNGKSYRCHKGDIFIVHFGADTAMECETEKATKFVVQLSGVSLPNILSACGLDTVQFIRPADVSRLEFYFNNLYSLMETEDVANAAEISRNTFGLLVELAEQAVLTSLPEPLQQAVNYMRMHVKKNLQLDDLVAYSGVSQATLHRLFSKYMHTSPINYFLEIKINEARKLITQHHRIKEVAAMLNYSSAQYFSNEFKKRFGVSPRNFKQNGES